MEWGDILRDLDRLQEITLEQDGKRFLLRTPTTVSARPPRRRVALQAGVERTASRSCACYLTDSRTSRARCRSTRQREWRRWIDHRNAVAGNPVDGVKRPMANGNEGTTPALGDRQARRLLESPPADTLKGIRDRAILATLLYHGIRREEPCGLRRSLHRVHAGVAKGGEWTGLITPGTLAARQAPLKWRRPMRLFTCSMSDFWHERVPLELLDEALDLIEATPWHTYFILTKRPGNIRRKLADLNRRLPPNVWLGATVGHPKSLPLLKPLLRVDAPVRFLSVEPLLAPMVPRLTLDGIGWVIGGGESPQPKHPPRPCDPDWMRALRDLCVSKNVAFFLKQWGIWENNPTPLDQELDPDAKGGATLDARLWRDFPPR
jgi:protein gp37